MIEIKHLKNIEFHNKNNTFDILRQDNKAKYEIYLKTKTSIINEILNTNIKILCIVP